MAVNFYVMSELGLAKEQSLAALFHCFRVIDCFASPSLDAQDYSKYMEIRDKLLEMYSDGINMNDNLHLFI